MKAWILFLSLTFALHAGDPHPFESPPSFDSSPRDFVFQNEKLSEALRSIARTGGINLVTAPEVNIRVTTRIIQQTPMQAIEQLAKNYDLQIMERDDIHYVLPRGQKLEASTLILRDGITETSELRKLASILAVRFSSKPEKDSIYVRRMAVDHPASANGYVFIWDGKRAEILLASPGAIAPLIDFIEPYRDIKEGNVVLLPGVYSNL